MAQTRLEQKLLHAVRVGPERTLDELAEDVGSPRTNFGRTLGSRVRAPMLQLVRQGLVEEHGRHYRLSALGRRALADRALSSTPEDTGEASQTVIEQ